MIRTAATCLLLLSTAQEGRVPFAPPWDDASPGPTHVGATLHRPAGSRGPVAVKNGQLRAGDERLRLFGVNLTAGACFPDRPTADKVAARMAKFGINAVRFHFLDAAWGEPRLIDYGSGDWSRWNAEALERLDYFVARLREEGIYLNFNLLVGREFGVGDGVDPAIRAMGWKRGHAAGFFHAPHLEAQKAFARKLLLHRNPHTMLTYAEDPAVALVEVNNENGLLHSWMDGTLDALPRPFADDLRAQWNRWLLARYANAAALERAWGVRAEPLGDELLSNGRFEQGLHGWAVERHAGAKATARADGGAAVLAVEAGGSAGWHVQFHQGGLRLAKDGLYTATFRAAADGPRRAAAYVMQNRAPWGSLGLQAPLALDREWRTFAFTFAASGSDDNARFGFSDLGQSGATFRFADLSLRRGGRLGLAEGEALGAIAAPKAGGPSLPAARRDWIRFLWETERAYWREMRRFLKEELGVKAPLAGTIVATSTPTLMAEFDVVDTHAYWQHPHFPGAPWDMDDWTVGNVSMVDRLGDATVTRLALQRVAGKPHMVSEYNHPAPNPHAGEGPLFLAAAAGLQDWDALFLYTYAHDDAGLKAGRIPGFFDVGQHPTIMANALVASLMFRRGDVAPARGLLAIPWPPEREIDAVASRGAAWNVAPVPVDPKNALRVRTALDLSSTAPLPPAPVPADAKEVVSDTGEIAWRPGVLEIRSPRAKAVVGHLDGREADLGDGVRVSVRKTRNGWCTVALVALEGDPFSGRGRALVVATGDVENTEMGWKDASRTSVGRNWGKAPSLVEVVAASVRLPRQPDAPLPLVHALDERGQRAGAVEVVVAGDAAELRIGPPHRTIWYEIELR